MDPGYDTRDIFTFQIAPEGEQLDDAASFARFHLAFKERLAQLPTGARRGGDVRVAARHPRFEALLRKVNLVQ